MVSALSLITRQDEGEDLWFGGGLVTIKISSKQSGGGLLLFEHAAGQGKTTPLHLHPDHDEIAYVHEGEIRLHLDGIEQTVGPGEVVWIPRGTPHALLVVSEVGRSLWVVTPGNIMEAFVREAGDPAPSRTLPSSELDIQRIMVAGEGTGAMKVLGPPPFERR